MTTSCTSHPPYEQLSRLLFFCQFGKDIRSNFKSANGFKMKESRAKERYARKQTCIAPHPSSVKHALDANTHTHTHTRDLIFKRHRPFLLKIKESTSMKKRAEKKKENDKNRGESKIQCNSRRRNFIATLSCTAQGRSSGVYGESKITRLRQKDNFFIFFILTVSIYQKVKRYVHRYAMKFFGNAKEREKNRRDNGRKQVN